MSAPVKHYNVVDMVVWRQEDVGMADVMPRRELLLITRGNEPFAGYLALPGGFIDEGETWRQAASRELVEETGVFVDPSAWRLVGVFDQPGRDPRGPVRAIAAQVSVPANTKPKAGDDAEAAQFMGADDLDLETLAFDHGDIVMEAVLR